MRAARGPRERYAWVGSASELGRRGVSGADLRALLFEPVRPSCLREVVAFCVAPLAGAFALWAPILTSKLIDADSLDPSELQFALIWVDLGPLLLIAVPVYAWTFLVALPTYLLLCDLDRVNAATIHGAALLLGGASLGALWGVSGGWQSSSLLASIGAPCGLVGGLVFYRISAGPRRAGPPRPRSGATAA
jgi:hypothetical protein